MTGAREQRYGLLAPAAFAPAALDKLAPPAFIASERERWTPVLLRAKVKPD